MWSYVVLCSGMVTNLIATRHSLCRSQVPGWVFVLMALLIDIPKSATKPKPNKTEIPVFQFDTYLVIIQKIS